MTKQTKTLLWILGGATVVGSIGTAIYFATKKPDAKADEGKTLPPDDSSKKTTLPQTTSPEINAAMDALVHLRDLFPKGDWLNPETGNV